MTAARNTYYRSELGFDFYTLSIILKDSGNPQQTGTSILTIIVESINENRQSSGDKQITVYNYKWLLNDVNIGHVYAADKDDWDRYEKTYAFVTEDHTGFV